MSIAHLLKQSGQERGDGGATAEKMATGLKLFMECRELWPEQMERVDQKRVQIVLYKERVQRRVPLFCIYFERGLALDVKIHETAKNNATEFFEI